MKRFARPFALLLALCAFASVAHAKDDGHDKDRAFITKAVKDMDTTANNKDADGYIKYTADDFVDINVNGEETTHGKAERREKMVSAYRRGMTISGHTTIKTITFDKQGAIVTETGDSSFTLNHNGQQLVATVTGTWRDLWVKSGNGWLEKRSRTLIIHRLLNGRPIQPQTGNSAPPA